MRLLYGVYLVVLGDVDVAVHGHVISLRVSRVTRPQHHRSEQTSGSSKNPNQTRHAILCDTCQIQDHGKAMSILHSPVQVSIMSLQTETVCLNEARAWPRDQP